MHALAVTVFGLSLHVEVAMFGLSLPVEAQRLWPLGK